MGRTVPGWLPAAAGALTLTCSDGTGPDRVIRLVAAGTTLYLGVDGAALSKPASAYVVLAAAAPVITPPIMPTEGAVPFRVPTVGWTETRSTSRYEIEGLAAGTHTVSVVGETGDITLAVYSDTTYSFQLDCTLQNFSAAECTVAGTALYFAVSTGPVNRDPSGYIMLIW